MNSRRTREELRDIFHRRNASAQSLNFRIERQPCIGGSNRSQSAQGGKGKHPKTTTFSREVVLLRTPDDGIVRGAVKADLQRLSHITSEFQLDKTWPANVALEKLLSAFERSVPSPAKITCEPKLT